MTTHANQAPGANSTPPRKSTADVFYGENSQPSGNDRGEHDEPQRSDTQRDPKAPQPSNEEVFYGEGTRSAIETSIAEDMVVVAAGLDLTPEQSKQLSKQTAEIFDEVGVSSKEAPQYFRLYREVLLNPPDETTLRDWRIESMRTATETYGAEEAQKRIARVQQYLQANPTLKAELNNTGLGSHPKVVKAFLEQAHRLKLAAP
jgi:hypothetical protein